jgi:hypothetical protein
MATNTPPYSSVDAMVQALREASTLTVDNLIAPLLGESPEAWVGATIMATYMLKTAEMGLTTEVPTFAQVSMQYLARVFTEKPMSMAGGPAIRQRIAALKEQHPEFWT